MKLCSFRIDLRIEDDELSEREQEALLEDVDALNLPYRLRRCVRATLDRFLHDHPLSVRVEE